MYDRPRARTPRSKQGKHAVNVYTDKELWAFLITSLEKKKENKRKRDPDMLRNAVLELTVQRLNEEIIERCTSKVKRQRMDDSYEWPGSTNSLGWSMTASYQDNEDLLGIDAFFQKISACEGKSNASTIPGRWVSTQ